jgi:hypothetical protein
MLSKIIFTTCLNTQQCYIVFYYEKQNGSFMTKARQLTPLQAAHWNNFLNQHCEAQIRFCKWYQDAAKNCWIRIGYDIH